MSKITFFGTHDFGAAMLKSLIEDKHEIIEVITQPDRPVGREQILTASPVKQLADSFSLKVSQPENLKAFELFQIPDLIVVCQYGLIMPKKLLDTPNFKSLNVHTSLLPKFRGASPIQSAIIKGEKETGVTIMLMDEKMDHGPILAQEKIVIDENDKYPELRKKLAPIAAKLLTTTVRAWLKNDITPKVQDENFATYCKIYSRDDGRINWNLTALEIFNLFRGLYPWPGIWTTLNKKRVKLLNILPSSENLNIGIISYQEGRILVGCAVGTVEILELQLEGKKPLKASEFIAGYQKLNGQVFE